MKEIAPYIGKIKLQVSMRNVDILKEDVFLQGAQHIFVFLIHEISFVQSDINCLAVVSVKTYHENQK